VISEICTEAYTPKLLRSNPDKIFVFGDNMKGFGKGGQAIIRDESNAFGVPTKRYPSKDNWAYFSDKEDERLAVLSSLRKLYVIGQSKVIVFPSGGIGTGLARMGEKSPKIFEEMNGVLKDFFGFDNGNL
jgi:hypothetical protein